MKRMYYFKLPLVIGLCMSGLVLCIGQSKKTKYDNFDLIEAYTETIESYSELPRGLSIDSMDIWERKEIAKKVERRFIVNKLDKKGGMTNTVVIERPQDLAPEMPYVAKIIEDDIATTYFDAKGKIVRKEIHKADKLESRKAKKDKVKTKGKFEDVQFIAFSDDIVKGKNGKAKGLYKKLSAFEEEMDYDSLVLRQNIKTFVNEIQFRQKDKKELHYSKIFYKIQTNGDLVLDKKFNRDSLDIKLRNGKLKKLTKIRNESRSDYFIYKDNKYKPLKGRSKGDITLSVIQNPVENGELTLKISENDIVGPVQINLYNISGVVVKTIFVDFTNTESRIDITELNSGLYFLASNRAELFIADEKIIKL